MTDYQNINIFMDSVKEKIISELSIDFVRPVLLDDGVIKNALFLLTKHHAGMLLIIKFAFKIACIFLSIFNSDISI